MPMRPVVATLALVLAMGSGAALATPAQAAETDVPPAVADVAIILPLTVPVTDPAVVYANKNDIPTTVPTLIDATTLAFYTSPSGILTTELDAVADSGVTIAIDPLILASIRALGSDTPPSARDWLARLGSVTNDTFALNFADSDLTAPLQAGRRNPVTVDSLDYAINPALFSTDSAATPAPGAPPEETDPNAPPPLPTSDDLTAWNYTLPSVAWPRADTVVARDFSILGSRYNSTILASTNVKRTVDSNASAAVGTRSAIVADSVVSTLVATALSAPDVTVWDASIAAIQASIATAASSSNGASVVITLDRDAPIDTTRLTATIAAISGTDAADLVGLSTITAIPGSKTTLVDKAQSTARVSRTKALLSSEREDAEFATIADDPTLVTQQRRVRLAETLSPSAERQAGGWGAATNTFLDESMALEQSVRLEPGSDVLLLANRESITFAVRNDLGQDITAYVEVRSLNPNLKVEKSEVTLKVGASSQRTASVPVQAVSNGEVELEVTLMSTAGVQVGDPIYRKINVQAGWEGPVTTIGGILVVLIFAVGIVRTVVRRRRAATADATAADATADPQL